MKTRIARHSAQLTVTIANGAALSEAFDFSEFSGGHVITPDVWTAANIGFQVSATQSGTYTILRDKAGAPVQVSTVKTDGGRAYSMPDEVFGALWVKLWSKNTTAATETDTNQGGARTLGLTLKG